MAAARKPKWGPRQKLLFIPLCFILTFLLLALANLRHYQKIALHRTAVRLGLTPLSYASQNGQDMYVYSRHFARRPKRLGGVFVEFGASDGVSNSNTYFFETKLGWKGICVEAVKRDYESMRRVRPGCEAVHGAVLSHCEKETATIVQTPFQGTAGVRGHELDGGHVRASDMGAVWRGKVREYEVPCFTLEVLLRRAGYKHVDYLSIDTEGGELELVEAFPWSEFRIDVVQIEAVSRTLKNKLDRVSIISAMLERGYSLDAELSVVKEQATTDLIFVRGDEQPG